MGIRAVIDAKGRLFIPAEVRKSTRLREGANVVIQSLGDGEFKVSSLTSVARRSAGVFRHLRGDGESVSEELIEDRKREAVRETE